MDGPAIGVLVTGIVALVADIVLRLRGFTQVDEDQTLAKLSRVVEAQGGWIEEQAEQIVLLKADRDEIRVRVVATEQHARECDRKLAALTEFVHSQGLTPPP